MQNLLSGVRHCMKELRLMWSCNLGGLIKVHR